jgi:hypothetical protein
MKNYLGQSLGLVLLIFAMLTALSVLPPGSWLRRMDIFEDIRSAKPVEYPGDLEVDSVRLFLHDTVASAAMPADTVGETVSGPVPPVDSAFFGRIIEDYTPDQHGLDRFFGAIDSIRSHGRKVRVAFYGDSFVEGDILLGDLRDTLQTCWGGSGVGFVPMTSEVARFKRTLIHRYENWVTSSIIKQTAGKPPLGINGFAYLPEPEAFVHYEGTRFFRHTGAWGEVRLFYRAENDLSFLWQNKGMPAREEKLAGRPGRLSTWEWGLPEPSIEAFAMRFPAPQGLTVYGASLEGGPGFYIDNFSVRGNTGGKFRLLQPALMRQFDAAQRYDLVVVQLGLNAVTNSVRNLPWYRKELDQTFAHLRACFPHQPILIVSVADKAGKVDGELMTMPSVPHIAVMQRELAREHGFLFYDLFHGMGGPGAMVALANARPALANKDYTHLTHQGGKVLGHLFARLFLDEQQEYRSGLSAVGGR